MFKMCHNIFFFHVALLTNIQVRESRWVGCVSVTYECYMGAERVIHMSQDASSVPSLPLPPFRGRKAMTTLLIIISSVFICLTASSGARTPTHSQIHTVGRTHTIFPPGLAGRTALLIQRREGQLDRVHL